MEKNHTTMNDETVKRGPGRPRKATPVPETIQEVKRGRGRPRLSEEEKKERAELRKLNPTPPTKGFGALQNMEPGDNSKFLSLALAVRNMPPINRADPVQVEQRVGEYLDLCCQYDVKPTVKGLCNALRIERTTIFEWKRGIVRAGTHQEVILRAYDLLEELWENYMQNGKINPVSGIFLGKNNFGYADKQEYVLTPNQGGVPEAADVATIEAKYAELPDSED